MKRMCFMLLAVCLVLLCACKETPSTLSEQPTTTTGDGIEWDQYQRPPAITLNETQKVTAGSCRWSRITDGDKAQLCVDAPHPHTYFSEKHPMLYAKKGAKNTVSVSCELPPKTVKVTAYKMSNEQKTAIPIEVDKKQTFTLLDDDFYAYEVVLQWERLGNTDTAHYYVYSKVK